MILTRNCIARYCTQLYLNCTFCNYYRASMKCICRFCSCVLVAIVGFLPHPPFSHYSFKNCYSALYILCFACTFVVHPCNVLSQNHFSVQRPTVSGCMCLHRHWNPETTTPFNSDPKWNERKRAITKWRPAPQCLWTFVRGIQCTVC